MKKKRDFYISLAVFIGSPIAIIVGILMTQLSDNNRVIAIGALFILLAAWALLLWGVRLLTNRSAKKEEAKKSVAEDMEKLIDEAYKQFCECTDYPEVNTLRLVKADMKFAAEGRYVIEPYFKKIPGDHFAFEIKSTNFISMPDDYDDVCNLKDSGVLISAGYHDGEALEKYANDNGIILPDTLSRVIGKPIKLGKDEGYKLEIWTVEGDEADYGFIKILKCENDVMTVFFSLTALWGLSDIVEGVVELKKETLEQARDIDSLIAKVKRKQYNVIEVSEAEVKAIKEANPFLPESYITFLREVGFADMDWIDVGRNEKTPANINEYEIKYMEELAAANGEINYEDFYFFAVDNGSTYYAFSRKDGDKKVYIFNDAAEVDTFEGFEEFLFEILSA